MCGILFAEHLNCNINVGTSVMFFLVFFLFFVLFFSLQRGKLNAPMYNSGVNNTAVIDIRINHFVCEKILDYPVREFRLSFHFV